MATLLKVARLQTLIVREQEKAEMPEIETLKVVSVQTGKDVTTVMAQSLEVQEDNRTILMRNAEILECDGS